MDKINVFKEYCTGCGLCASVQGTEFKKDSSGFPVPMLSDSDLEFCEDACAASGTLWNNSIPNIWGDYTGVYTGWSKDPDIRKKASTGGVLTSVCIYLLENGIVDGIIQTKSDENIPYGTVTVISRNSEEVRACMGSRYSISQPLKEIKQIIDSNERYCFVGKPCDVKALRAYMKRDEILKNSIPIMLSFFCAGTPSENAQKRLLEKLGCSANECRQLIYRGNGWPGYTVVKKKDNTENRITYGESWREILGRDVRKSCRFCLDGIGIFSDIVCGDCWNIRDGKPDFVEADGKNVIFARNEFADQLLKDAEKKEYIHLEEFADKLDDLKISQYYQHDRRATMYSMVCAMKFLAKPIPFYPRKILSDLSKNISAKKRVRRFLGVIKRSIQKKF